MSRKTQKPAATEEEQQDGEQKVLTATDRLGTILKKNAKDHVNFQERVTWRISTGSLLLDLATGGVGPSVVRLAGYNNTGKTPEALEIARNFLGMDNSRCVWVLAEGRLSEENKTRCGLEFVTKWEDWKDGTVFILESNIYELYIELVRDLVLNNPEGKRYCFVVDSLDGMMRREDAGKPVVDAAKVAGPQLLTKKMFQSLSVGMLKFGHLMVMTSQVTSEIKLNEYVRTVDRGGQFSGGNAANHWSDFTFEYQPLSANSFILDNPEGFVSDGKSKAMGRLVSVVLNKSTLEKSMRTKVTYPVKFGRKPSGIWVEHEVASMLTGFDMVKKTSEKGSWLSFTPETIKELAGVGVDAPEKVQGMGNLRVWLEGNPKATTFLVGKFKSILSSS